MDGVGSENSEDLLNPVCIQINIIYINDIFILNLYVSCIMNQNITRIDLLLVLHTKSITNFLSFLLLSDV